MDRIADQHVELLLQLLSLADEGYLISCNYANAINKQHFINQGKRQMDFYADVLDSVTAELITIGILFRLKKMKREEVCNAL